MKLRSLLAFAILSMLLTIVACSDDEDPGNMMMNNNDECSSEVSFSNDVQPILNVACALSGCHVEGFASGDFRSYGDVKDRASRVSSRVVAETMPPANSSGPSLTDSQIETIKCWVDQGAPDN